MKRKIQLKENLELFKLIQNILHATLTYFRLALSSPAGMSHCKHPVDANFCSVLLVGTPLTDACAFPKGRTLFANQTWLPRRAMGVWTLRPNPLGRDAEGIAQPSQWSSLEQQVIHCDRTSQLLCWQTRSPPTSRRHHCLPVKMCVSGRNAVMAGSQP